MQFIKVLFRRVLFLVPFVFSLCWGVPASAQDFQRQTIGTTTYTTPFLQMRLNSFGFNPPLLFDIGSTAGTRNILQAVPLTTANTYTFAVTAPAQATLLTFTDPGSTSANVAMFANTPSALQTTPQVEYVVTSAYTNATTTFSNVTGLSLTVAAGTNYKMTCHITWQGSATTTGPKYQFTGPASPTSVASSAFSMVTASTVTQTSAVALSTSMPNAGTITATTNFTDLVTIGLQNGATAGTLQLQAAANGAGTLTIQPGSYCESQ
jgi:hypothetical protein